MLSHCDGGVYRRNHRGENKGVFGSVIHHASHDLIDLAYIQQCDKGNGEYI